MYFILIFQRLFLEIDHCGGIKCLAWKLILIIAAKQTELFSIMCTPKTLFRMSLFYWELVKLNPKNGNNLDLDFFLSLRLRSPGMSKKLVGTSWCCLKILSTWLEKTNNLTVFFCHFSLFKGHPRPQKPQKRGWIRYL